MSPLATWSSWPKVVCAAAHDRYLGFVARYPTLVRRVPLLALVVALPAAVLGLARARPFTTANGRIERGKYLVSAMGCGGCHTPRRQGPAGPKSDESRFLSGHREGSMPGPPPQLASGPWIALSSRDGTAWAGPWGVGYSANLTPDENTGIGSWSEETFVQALRTGRHMGVSRPILPPMPWGAFRNLNDEDLRSIYAYLRTVPPVRNRVPELVAPPAVDHEGSRP